MCAVRSADLWGRGPSAAGPRRCSYPRDRSPLRSPSWAGRGPSPALRGRAAWGLSKAHRTPGIRPPAAALSADHPGEPAPGPPWGPDARGGRCKGPRAREAKHAAGRAVGERPAEPPGIPCAPGRPAGAPGLARGFPREPARRGQVGAAGPGQRPLGSGSAACFTSVLPASQSWEKEGWGCGKIKGKVTAPCRPAPPALAPRPPGSPAVCGHERERRGRELPGLGAK